MVKDNESIANIEEAYNSIKDDVKISISFKDLNSKFNLDELDDSTRVLKKIRQKITDMMEDYSKLIEEIISPDSNLKDIIESKEIEENLKTELFKTYKQIRYIIRWSNLCELENTNEKDKKFIESVYQDMDALKNKIIKVVEILKNCWIKDDKTDERQGYFG